ncbi:MAG: glutamate racemase [Gammaproteobacteria bacterium]|jgi:glutamate racemase
MIGVFDSGVGGLSVLREIRMQLPGESLVYVADSGHAPYGDRSTQYIEARATAIVEFLVGAGARAIVIACNTATVVAARSLRAWCPVPIVAMEPAIKPAVALTRSGVVGVLATRRTLESPSVARLCELHGPATRILLQPCPGLVDRVERGDLEGTATRGLLQSYLDPLLSAGADTLVLGCTHYPFLAPVIRELAGPGVSIVDPSAAVARELGRRLVQAAAPGALLVPGPAGTERFYTSGPLPGARELMGALWGREIELAPLPLVCA